MKQEYSVVKPQDFQLVIGDILDLHKQSKQTTLVIALQGDLGAGKTTFTQVLGHYLEVDEIIVSPTFMIIKKYELSNKPFDSLVHIDAYRIESEEEIRPLRFDEVFHKPNTIVCVEWPELIPSVMPNNAVRVNIKIEANEVRKVTVL